MSYLFIDSLGLLQATLLLIGYRQACVRIPEGTKAMVKAETMKKRRKKQRDKTMHGDTVCKLSKCTAFSSIKRR